ncbi:MAG: DUF1566 domain-containing protein, partial [Candidatus Brocadiae bacterium]|nr:DUF1566 domain-containing protein [Candidatus Brocadiia bacterium]
YQGKNVIDISGTLPYMSPEQYLGQPSLAATDNWALGVIVYEMLAGYHPFQGTSFEHYMKLICEIDPLKIEGLSESTWTVLQKMFDKDRKSRPQRAEEWMKELIASKVLASEKTKSRPVATSFKHFSIDKNKVEIVRQEIEIEKQKKEKIHREAEKEKKMVVQLPDTKKFEEEWKRRESKQNQREEEKKIKQPEPKKSEEKAEKEKIAIQNEKKKKWEEEQEREETWLPEGKASEGIKIPRYSLKGTEIIQDAKTRLEWLVGPDEDMNWDEAVSWVGSISTFRYGKGWRMPTKKELRAIYKSGEGRRNLSLLFKTTGWWVWAGNFPTPPLSCVFDFYSGKESRYNRSHRVCGRVFAVRDGK